MRKLAITIGTTLGLVIAGCVSKPAHVMNSAFLDVVPAPGAVARPNGNGNSSGAIAVGDFVRSRSPQLQFCYEETRAKTPSLAGSGTIAVLLAPDGVVSDADIVRRTWVGKGTEILESCVLTRVRTWKFPASETGVDNRVHSFSVIFTR